MKPNGDLLSTKFSHHPADIRKIATGTVLDKKVNILGLIFCSE